MARAKLSEYRAKTLLQPDYPGVPLAAGGADYSLFDHDLSYVIKVDQGVKKRGKLGLLKLNVAVADIDSAISELSEKGYSRFLAEPMIQHDQEHYVSFERVRNGILFSYSDHGGIDVEDHPEKLKHFTLSGEVPDDLPLPHVFVTNIVEVMNREHMSFVEINPLVFVDDQPVLLDAAVLVDDTAPNTVSWREEDLVSTGALSDEEKAIRSLAESSTAAFSFSVLKPDAPIWLLLSGGGASITIADEASNVGHADKIGNYGEYSGGPTSDETYLYTREVIKALLKSSAQKKALVIAGGVANFTDIRTTFNGITKALDERKDELVKNQVRIFVRRGGPNEVEGLEHMKSYLESNELFGSIHGSEALLTAPILEALDYVNN